MKRATASSSPVQLAEAIRGAGARATHARMSVLGLLKAAASPLSHADAEAMLAGDGKKMDRVTLYRVLDWLAEHGLAHKAADARGVFRYSAAEPDGNHAAHGHFHCQSCGGVYCLDVPAPRSPRLPRGFRLHRIALDIEGECARCSRTQA